MVDYTRRRLLAATAGVAGLGAVAGCSGGSGQSNAADVQSSFFVFSDIAANVAGDSTTTDLLVPLGQHGHGRAPGPRVRENIYNASVFVHGMAGFQPWADDIVADLEADGAEVTAVDVSADVSLLPFGASHDDHSEDSHSDHEDETEPNDESHDEHETEPHDEHETEPHDESHDEHETEPHDEHETEPH